MQKQAPSSGRVLVAIGFTLSCFALLLFLWVSFGGPLPLKSKSYRITAYFPEAITLPQESDVRISGVTVGKVKSIELAPSEYRVGGQDTTEAVLEIDPEFAPISTDARAILRQKTLVGETYVELTSGTEPGGTALARLSLGSASAGASDAAARGAHPIPEGGTLGLGQTQDATQIDEIFNALDRETRDSFRRWMKDEAVATDGRGLDLNDSLGDLGPALGDASDILAVLRRQKTSLRGLVHDTGTAFTALSERDGELAGAITGSERTFGALADQERALAETFRVLPVFRRESRLTLDRLDRFQADARPLVDKLLPVAKDVSPTFRSVRALSPTLRSVLEDLHPVISAARRGLPAAAGFLTALKPVLAELDPFLANLNPVIGWLRYYRTEVENFIGNPPAALAGTLGAVPGQPAPRHALRQVGYLSSESLSVYQARPDTNRGNGYLKPDLYRLEPELVKNAMFPSFDCNNTGGERLAGDGGDPPVGVGFAPCFTPRDSPAEFGGERAPQVSADP